jgi:integrase
VQELKQILANKDQSGEIDFLAFAAQYMQELEAKGKSGSYRGSRGLITHLKGFASKINFSDINAQFLSHFEEYLRKEGVNDIHTYFARLRLIFNRGKDFYNDEDRGIIRIPNYPFKKVKIKKTVHSANEHSLTVAQARRLLSYQPKNEREQLGKDVFAIMTCLMGINAIDLFYLKKPLKNRVDYTRSKTGRKYSIKIEPELQEFINRIPGSGGQLFNFSERYQNFAVFHKAVNTGLKSICKEIRGQELNKTDFPENVTSNWARHTWATIARNDCGINKDDVALCLGHVDTDNRVTDMYIKYDYSIIDGANRKVLDKNS